MEHSAISQFFAKLRSNLVKLCIDEKPEHTYVNKPEMFAYRVVYTGVASRSFSYYDSLNEALEGIKKARELDSFYLTELERMIEEGDVEQGRWEIPVGNWVVALEGVKDRDWGPTLDAAKNKSYEIQKRQGRSWEMIE